MEQKQRVEVLTVSHLAARDVVTNRNGDKYIQRLLTGQLAAFLIESGVAHLTVETAPSTDCLLYRVQLGLVTAETLQEHLEADRAKLQKFADAVLDLLKDYGSLCETLRPVFEMVLNRQAVLWVPREAGE